MKSYTRPKRSYTLVQRKKRCFGSYGLELSVDLWKKLIILVIRKTRAHVVSKNCPPHYTQTFNTTTCRMRLGPGNTNTTEVQRGMTDISAAAKSMSKGRDPESSYTSSKSSSAAYPVCVSSFSFPTTSYSSFTSFSVALVSNFSTAFARAIPRIWLPFPGPRGAS